MAFDVEGARSAGYTESEIADHLAKQRGFDAAGARKSGYTDSDIVSHLSGGASMQHRSTPVDDRTGASYAARFSIGSAGDPQTKLARARAYFGDTVKAEGDRISYVDPASGRRMYVNPEGFDIGDIAGSAREIASAVPSVLAAPTLAGVAAGAGIGAGVGQGMDALAAYMARNEAAKRGNPMPDVQSPMDAAKEAGIEAGVGTALGAAAIPVSRGLAKVVNPTSERLVQAWRDLGMQPPSLAAVSEPGAISRVEGWLGDTLTGSQFVDRGARAGRTGLQNALDDAASRVAGTPLVPTTPDELGQLAKRVADANKQAWRQQASAQADALFNEFGGNPAGLQKTLGWIDTEAAKLAPEAGAAFKRRAEHLIRSELADAGTGELNVHTLRSLRTRMNQLADDPSTVTTGSVDKGIYSKIANTLKDDIEGALTPAQRDSFRTYNAEYAKQKGARDLLESALFGSGDTTKIGKALMSPNLSPDTVRAMQEILGQNEFNAIRSGVIRQLGTPGAGARIPDGQASPAAFSTLTGRGRGAYQPEVQQAMLGGDLDNVRLIAEGLENASRTMNTSRTGAANELFRLARSPAQIAQVGAAALLDPITSAAVPAALGFMHTSPAVINALSSPTARATAEAIRQLGPRAGTIGGLLAVHE